jgi:hypothetical protein
MDMPEFAPAFCPTRMWEMPADVRKIREPAFRPSMDMPEFAPAIPAFRPSWTCRNLLLQFRHSVHPWTSKANGRRRAGRLSLDGTEYQNV